MPRAPFDRESLFFDSARRLAEGIEVVAQFRAPKVSDPGAGVEYYYVTLMIDPDTRGVIKSDWNIPRQKVQVSWGGGKDKLAQMDRALRDEFLKSPAWAILSKRDPDPSYTIDEIGKPLPPLYVRR